MSDRTVWIVMGNIYHLFSNCGHINGRPTFTRTQDQAERQGFRLCKRCAKQDQPPSRTETPVSRQDV